MVKSANFQKQEFGGAYVATVHETDDEILEVMKLSNGNYELTIHNRRPNSDLWDDISVTLKPVHFAVLGSIATMHIP